ncbi:2-C-methyl-D-erythritol 2,4-cyclodiphosphate synthase [Ignatzschineria ureiclastica]|uniref:2-C-methyl-D-erythritol 2,4-cyclodiphosphate synthase n=2 Tax=Ignatzschineria TaxID=112008 RepID=A0A2U2AF46_9GAMM|nr:MULTISPECIES: 2-C-methyl-D-erythritol 2,4-cyclodiphosphate synthase [Ignatzschineria]PWD81284.1 2-C-methyl-D-erythritol 2,4-cyclodiphosphate synthase [Ignatzschineria ureiclastica]GGZ97754.1 2-C-methyl-D-erythritol 2,4-cyclodiphosphate synthase [Ignatzschineria ureiclastica]
MRIGFGFDVHTFEEGDHLMIGGVRIPFHKKFKAHSDGDVVLHALTDAILGAAKAGDIGTLFPDTDPAFKGADSRVLLKQAYKLVFDKGYRIGNIDITVLAERPKILPHREAIEQIIAGDLAISMNDINVKATTMEKMGFVGREEGIAAQVAVLLIER